MVVMTRLRHHGPRPERRGRLRRPARPRLRRVLCRRRLHRRLVRDAAVRAPQASTSCRSACCRSLPGLHINVWLLLIVGAVFAALLRHHHRPADAAPARRLPGDRHARVRRDHPAGREQRRRLVRPQRHQRAERPDADRLARVRRVDPQRGVRSCRRPTSSRSRTRPATTTGPASRSCCSRSSAASAFATRASAGPGWRSARTRSRRPRWASRSCARRRSPMPSARSSAAAPGCFYAIYKSSTFPRRLLAQHLDHGAVHGDPGRDGERLGRLPGRRACSRT